MYLSWSLCWYFYLALPAAESDSTSCDLLRGPSTNSGQLSASKACCSGRTCTTFLHRPIGMFLLVVEGTLSHFPISRLHILLWSKLFILFCSLDELTPTISHHGGSWPLYAACWRKLHWRCLTCLFQAAAPCQPTASAAGFHAQPNFLAMGEEPRFELKGSNFPSAPLLSSDSSSPCVYTSDKLNFVWALCWTVKNGLNLGLCEFLEILYTHRQLKIPRNQWKIY